MQLFTIPLKTKLSFIFQIFYFILIIFTVFFVMKNLKTSNQISKCVSLCFFCHHPTNVFRYFFPFIFIAFQFNRIQSEVIFTALLSFIHIEQEKWRRNSPAASLCRCHRQVPFSPTSFRPCTLIIGLVLMSYNAIAKIYNPVLSLIFAIN